MINQNERTVSSRAYGSRVSLFNNSTNLLKDATKIKPKKRNRLLLGYNLQRRGKIGQTAIHTSCFCILL